MRQKVDLFHGEEVEILYYPFLTCSSLQLSLPCQQDEISVSLHFQGFIIIFQKYFQLTYMNNLI